MRVRQEADGGKRPRGERSGGRDAGGEPRGRVRRHRGRGARRGRGGGGCLRPGVVVRSRCLAVRLRRAAGTGERCGGRGPGPPRAGQPGSGRDRRPLPQEEQEERNQRPNQGLNSHRTLEGSYRGHAGPHQTSAFPARTARRRRLPAPPFKPVGAPPGRAPRRAGSGSAGRAQGSFIACWSRRPGRMPPAHPRPRGSESDSGGELRAAPGAPLRPGHTIPRTSRRRQPA
jgi:hypothetical protein